MIPRYPYGTIGFLWLTGWVVVLSISLGDHEIVPKPGSARRVRDSEPADLTHVSDYPVEAVCLICGRPIRCERWLLAGWRHITTERDR